MTRKQQATVLSNLKLNNIQDNPVDTKQRSSLEKWLESKFSGQLLLQVDNL